MVSGEIRSAENQQPLIGVTIQVKGSLKQTATDNNGSFSFEATNEDVLVISSVGYFTQDIKAAVASAVLLNINNKNLTEVVVTALGIKREEKSLGYAAQKLSENVVNYSIPISIHKLYRNGGVYLFA